MLFYRIGACHVSHLKINIKKVYACIHLISIANDPMTDLDPALSWQTSALGSIILIEHLIRNKSDS